MTAIALFSTYRPSEGFGGPSRIFHQRLVLERAGHRVVHVVIEAMPSKASLRPVDLVHLVERPRRAQVDHIYEDVDLGRRAAADARLVRSTVDHLVKNEVSCIVLEQPFLVEVVEQIVERLDADVVYSSQNIEYRLRRDLERFQPDWRRPADRVDQVRALEQRAVALAHHVTAICPTDQDALQAEFACDSTLVPNGSSIVGFARSARTTSSSEPSIDFVFTGSSYWPNVAGFAQIATPSLAFLPPTSRIHVAGTVGQALLEHSDITRHLAINRSRLELHGFLSMPDLVEIVSKARSVLVPVFVGEGSNLKSADALAASVPVIMSRRATHGYEDVLAIDDEGVTIVDTPTEFRTAMLDALHQPHHLREVGTARAELLTWDTRLAPLVDVVEDRVKRARC